MDDALTVRTFMAGTRGAIIEFEQRIFRGPEMLVEAHVRVVTLRNERPVRPPRELVAHLATAPEK